MKYDLHLHSKFSKRPSQWVLQKIGCPESFSDPLDLHRLALKKGLTSLTLTDHNTIDGCLEIAHLPHAFISEEVTSYFPEDGCKVHVLVWGIDEAIHADLARARANLYDLVAYLRQSGLAHALAHPFFAVNGKLTVAHVEKLLLLFETLELNGARDEAQNQLLDRLVKGLTPRLMQELSERHGLEPAYPAPWRKNLVAGSDDHSALAMGRMYTEVRETASAAEFLQGVKSGRAVTHGRGSSPLGLAHNLYGIAYQYYKQRLPLGRYFSGQSWLRFLDQMLSPDPQPARLSLLGAGGRWVQRRRDSRQGRQGLQDILRREVERMIRDDPQLRAVARGRDHMEGERESRWFGFVERLTNQVLRSLGDRLFGHLSGANLFSIFETIGATGTLVFLLGPYFVPYNLFSRDRRLAADMRSRLEPCPAPPASPGLRSAHFTDTLHETNGVARILFEQAGLAGRLGKDMTIIACDPDRPLRQGLVRHFRPVSIYRLPEYPDQGFFLPPFLQIMDHVYRRGYNHLHSATPGPMGLTALAIARIMRLPISATYHTALPQYAGHLTGDPQMEDLLWRYMLWYYQQMDCVYVPSHATGQELVERGLSRDKLRLCPRGVDVQEFHPRQEGDILAERFGLGAGVRLIYVGRISKEKGLDLLATAFKALAARHAGLHLVLVGDGPHADELRRNLSGWPATFTGYLQGRDLARAYASADVFVFPSQTDTFGNVVMEAQASGLPVVVSDQGGPKENVRDGVTGMVVKGGCAEALAKGIDALLASPELRRRMGAQARAYMETRSHEQCFSELWELHCQEIRPERGTEDAVLPGEGPAWLRVAGSDLF
ncbi:MAG: glycosyltransferase [Thermodesulfobacteriota bacterium]